MGALEESRRRANGVEERKEKKNLGKKKRMGREKNSPSIQRSGPRHRRWLFGPTTVKRPVSGNVSLTPPLDLKSEKRSIGGQAQIIGIHPARGEPAPRERKRCFEMGPRKKVENEAGTERVIHVAVYRAAMFS